MVDRGNIELWRGFGQGGGGTAFSRPEILQTVMTALLAVIHVFWWRGAGYSELFGAAFTIASAIFAICSDGLGPDEDWLLKPVSCWL